MRLMVAAFGVAALTPCGDVGIDRFAGGFREPEVDKIQCCPVAHFMKIRNVE
jgi:hypothetical protein